MYEAFRESLVLGGKIIAPIFFFETGSHKAALVSLELPKICPLLAPKYEIKGVTTTTTTTLSLSFKLLFKRIYFHFMSMGIFVCSVCIHCLQSREDGGRFF